MTKRLTTFSTAALLLGGLAFVAGCQTSGSRDTTSSAPRSDTAVRATAEFDRAMVADRDTEWVSSTAADAEKGSIARGEQVWFDRAPGTSNWQQARTQAGRMVYVHPADFRRP